MHEVLINHLGGLSLPRKSVVRLTDCPDMTIDVYRGRKTTIQQQQQPFIWSTDIMSVWQCNGIIHCHDVHFVVDWPDIDNWPYLSIWLARLLAELSNSTGITSGSLIEICLPLLFMSESPSWNNAWWIENLVWFFWYGLFRLDRKTLNGLASFIPMHFTVLPDKHISKKLPWYFPRIMVTVHDMFSWI